MISNLPPNKSLKSKILYVICGPTAVGKTDFAVQLAKELESEIISADSRQLYKEIPIGTAQPSPAEMAQIPHHFIASRSLEEDYNAGMFERDALKLLDELFSNHNSVICCGGTGFYIKALCEGLDDVTKAHHELRAKLNQRVKVEGLAPLQAELKKLDPIHFELMDIQNPQRVIRALEVCISTGKPFSSFHEGEKKERPFRIVKIGLELPREELNIRINERVDAMLGNGWLEEAKAVFEKRHLNALNTVGYKELFAHLSGEMSLEEATEKIKVNTRRFAKRQMTWFKKDEEVMWFENPRITEILGLV